MERRSRFVDLGGARFHYLEYGDRSQRPLVFLHGIFSSAADYEGLLQPLAQQRRVLAPDQRGHGQTDQATEYTWTGLAEDLDAFAANIGLHSFDLVGYSMGAFAAARHAGTHPASVERLILIECRRRDIHRLKRSLRRPQPPFRALRELRSPKQPNDSSAGPTVGGSFGPNVAPSCH